MANICYASVVIDGDKEKLQELYNLLLEISEDEETPGYESVLEKRGVDTSDVSYSLRGSIEDFYFNEDDENPRLDIQIECAWGLNEDVLYDMFQFYDEEGDGLLNIYFSFETEGFIEFGTNDWEKKYFTNRYFIYDPNKGDDYNYYEFEKDVLEHLNEYLPDLKVEELEDEEKVNEQLNEKLGEENEIEYHKYWVD